MGRLKDPGLATSMQKNKASGSVWNPNSWHWETKNYNEPAIKYINDKVLDHTFLTKGMTFIFTNIKKLEVTHPFISSCRYHFWKSLDNTPN